MQSGQIIEPTIYLLSLLKTKSILEIIHYNLFLWWDGLVVSGPHFIFIFNMLFLKIYFIFHMTETDVKINPDYFFKLETNQLNSNGK